jgi:hypothetical protein
MDGELPDLKLFGGNMHKPREDAAHRCHQTDFFGTPQRFAINRYDAPYDLLQGGNPRSKAFFQNLWIKQSLNTLRKVWA